ncbi:hypothetical protein INS49_009099 [Diaporthe citri]|uniref:uncharacterized protein n=1 Tax=Diaporthe citri TaxID=83186 RepID=UPI001C7F0620|nr:uncharacterized protein INS49_009099 [Diaporthe citri]KAG6363996.1 hypothetical protein INS49_009099 [Diaporthe citri]
MGTPSKRGLCWPTDNHGKDEVLAFTKPGSKFVPMQWNHVNIDELAGHAAGAGAGAPATVLGFNEPELPDQSNMPAELAAREWLRCVEPLRRAGVRAGSPGISSAPHAVGWLREFLARVRGGGSDVDFYCLHWYGAELGQFYDYIWSTHHQLGPDRPAWITEYACTNWSVEDPLPREHVENFARESAKYLDTLDWVERYAWFGPMRDCGAVGRWAAMLDGEGRLTPLGRAYRDE